MILVHAFLNTRKSLGDYAKNSKFALAEVSQFIWQDKVDVNT